MSEKTKRNRRKLIIVLTMLILAALSVCGIVILKKYSAEQKALNTLELLKQNTWDIGTKTAEEETKEEELGIEIPQKNIDFGALQEMNTDIYAWIYIPNTNVDYPVLQHPSDDAYYLMRNLDGSYGYPGVIYTEPSVTNTNFKDFNTVVYGHNMNNGSMFATLHYFEDSTFYEENRYVFIYTPETVLVYEVFAAYNYNDKHLLKSIDISTEEKYQTYIDQIYQQSGNISQDIQVTSKNHILTLSTCTYADNKRWLVQAVLVNEKELER